MLDTHELGDRIALCKNWFINSGIQERNIHSANFGGLYAWFDAINQKYPFVYSEITGYGITAFIFLHHLSGENVFIKRAEDAAQWLIKEAIFSPQLAYRCKYFPEEKSFLNHLCSFDNSMILTGLSLLSEKHNTSIYKERAIALGDWLVNTMQKSDGSFHPNWEAGRGKFIETLQKWSTQAGSFHAKHAIGLLNLYRITGKRLYKESAIRLCDWSLSQQGEEGRFITNASDGSTNQHPHCYACEGLLYAGISLKEPKYVQAARKGMLWSLSSQLANGGFPSADKDGGFVNIERMDILAQIMRLALLCGQRGEKIKKAFDRLFRFQVLDDSRQKGGFRYGFIEGGTEVPHINAWVSMFALQAMIYYHDILQGK